VDLTGFMIWERMPSWSGAVTVEAPSSPTVTDSELLLAVVTAIQESRLRFEGLDDG
jgi:hypothetical protein